MTAPPEPSGLDHGYLRSGSVRLHYVTMGKGPLLLFLHGFPDFWYGWRHQLAEFARDHKVVALDMRGYNDSDKPSRLDDYTMTRLVADVAAVIAELGGGRATLVGHDWGGVVAWSFAEAYPEMLQKLIIINIPHPAVMAREMVRPPQVFKSWYIFMFQLPGLPELMVTRDHGALMESVFRGGAVNREAFNDTDIAVYRDAICKPGVATAALNYYRNVRANARPHWGTIKVPTTLIWGMEDRALGPNLIDGNAAFVSDLTIHRVPGAGHFPHQEKPHLVNSLIRDSL